MAQIRQQDAIGEAIDKLKRLYRMATGTPGQYCSIAVEVEFADSKPTQIREHIEPIDKVA